LFSLADESRQLSYSPPAIKAASDTEIIRAHTNFILVSWGVIAINPKATGKKIITRKKNND